MARSLRILVVDDDLDNANSLGELFEMEGHSACVVHSGEAAVEAFRQQHFDVAFMDVMMPGKNGVESFLEIKSLCPEARVYMMTGYSVEQLLRQALDNGALGVMSKPVDPVKVLRVLSDTGPDGIVVLADDDPGAGPELEKIISGAGRACHLVRDSAEVLGGGTAAHSNILIFDLKTPLIQGLEVYRELHKSGHMAPAIIITASGPQYRDTVDAMRDVAITGILNKPFDPVGLLDRLDWLAA